MRSTKLIISVIGVLIIPIAIGMFLVNWQNLADAAGVDRLAETIQRTVSVIIGMIPSGMLLLTSLALTVGILRLASHNTLVQDLYSLEMLARVNVLCLDKTGTITDGRMKVNDCMLLNNPTDYTINEIVGSCLHSLEDNNQTSIALYNYFGHSTELKAVKKMPFSSKPKTFGRHVRRSGDRGDGRARIRAFFRARKTEQDHQPIRRDGTARARRRPLFGTDQRR